MVPPEVIAETFAEGSVRPSQGVFCRQIRLKAVDKSIAAACRRKPWAAWGSLAPSPTNSHHRPVRILMQGSALQAALTMWCGPEYSSAVPRFRGNRAVKRIQLNEIEALVGFGKEVSALSLAVASPKRSFPTPK